MLNDFHMMVLAILASQGGIAALLVVMAKLEPKNTEAPTARQATPRPGTSRQVASRAPAAPSARSESSSRTVRPSLAAARSR